MPKELGRRLGHDVVLIASIGVVAACGLIYEYLLAHYAGRILGVLEPTLYAMIGLMITAMGLGAFAAQWVKSLFRGFAWLELIIGVLGATSVLVLSAAVALTYLLPDAIRTTYALDESLVMDGGIVAALYTTSRVLPFVLGGLIGFLVGMEIPLIARIREHIHRQRLEHNLGTMYGADYVGAGMGAVVWIVVCLKIPIVYAAVGTAAMNAMVGIGFLLVYRRNIGGSLALWLGHGLLVVLLVVMALYGTRWITDMTNMLFADRVVYQLQTPHQNLVITKRHISRRKPDILSLYINGRLQFASNDERIYHSYLTTPAMLAAVKRESVLVLGGGDGMAARDLLRWPEVRQVTLVDLDDLMLSLFRGRDANAPNWLSQALVARNENALNDPRVQLVVGDAFIEVDRLIDAQAHYDVIVVDLPDPSHPDLNRLYTDYFYARLKQLLSPDGALVVQSTSPYHAKSAYLSVGKSLAAAGFKVEGYHANVPSFGEWGWQIGVPQGAPASERIQRRNRAGDPDGFVGKPQLTAAFVFPRGYFDALGDVKVNRLGTHTLYDYHEAAWRSGYGIYYADDARSKALGD